MSSFIKNISIVLLHYQILAILNPTSLANLVVQRGTRHSHHQILLSAIQCSNTLVLCAHLLNTVLPSKVRKRHHTFYLNCFHSRPERYQRYLITIPIGLVEPNSRAIILCGTHTRALQSWTCSPARAKAYLFGQSWSGCHPSSWFHIVLQP